MDKPLDQMSEEELGLLFPIMLVEHDPGWGRLFHLEEKAIGKTIGRDHIIRMEHIGSTAIPGIMAKPSIDILLEVSGATPDQHIIVTLQQAGYHFIPRPENPPPHMMFVKGYTKEGFKGQSFHIHVRYEGHWDEIPFRDYLLAHPDAAREYEELKVRLASEFRNDREGYTEGKTEFVKKVIRMARG
jgi:GrpB-like predicted nucleotidyltransferase (UPF0157 family)